MDENSSRDNRGECPDDKSGSITFRVSALELRRLERRAGEARKTLAAYARDMTLGQPIYDAALGEAYSKAFGYASQALLDDQIAQELFAECFRCLDRYFK